MPLLNITNLDIVYCYRNVVYAALSISEYFILLHRFSSNGLQTLFTQFIFTFTDRHSNSQNLFHPIRQDTELLQSESICLLLPFVKFQISISYRITLLLYWREFAAIPSSFQAWNATNPYIDLELHLWTWAYYLGRVLRIWLLTANCIFRPATISHSKLPIRRENKLTSLPNIEPY